MCSAATFAFALFTAATAAAIDPRSSPSAVSRLLTLALLDAAIVNV